jgi:hypothetical protein
MPGSAACRFGVTKLFGSIVLVAVASGCVAHARPVRVVEQADPIVGDLRCARPRMSLLEALYHAPDPTPVPEHCEPRANL